MGEKIRIAGVIEESIVDGPGIRYVVFTQGCPHHCEGCHNPQSHSFDGGRIEDTDKILEEILANPLLSGVTLSGGEPICQAKELIEFVKKLKENKKHIMMYTGYTFEQLRELGEDVQELISLCDIIVDGRFRLEEKSMLLHFRGSKNQRLIDVKKTLEMGEVVLADL